MMRFFCPSLLLLLLLVSCVAAPPVDRLASLRQDDGSILWQEEYAFVPPQGWQLITLDEDDYSLAFARSCEEYFPCQSTMAFAEEPFGFSRDLEKRQEEFFRRYLWASRVVFSAPQLEWKVLHGRQALVAVVEGVEPVKDQKVWSKVVFTTRGERVIAYYYNQWRPGSIPFDLAEVADFDRFVDSFRFLKPSFYELL